MGVKQIAKMAREGFSKNKPIILVGLGMVGIVATAVLAAKATLKHADTLKRKDLTAKQKAKKVWRSYIPAVMTGTFTAACVTSAQSIQAARTAAAVSLYEIGDAKFRDYRDKVRTVVGAGKEQKVQDAVAEDKVKQNPPSVHGIIATNAGKVLCYDMPSGRYFESDIEHVRQTVNDLNFRLRTDMTIDMNELYSALGLPEIPLGNYYGWDIEKNQIIFKYSSQLAEGTRPCLVIDYDFYPLRI